MQASGLEKVSAPSSIGLQLCERLVLDTHSVAPRQLELELLVLLEGDEEGSRRQLLRELAILQLPCPARTCKRCSFLYHASIIPGSTISPVTQPETRQDCCRKSISKCVFTQMQVEHDAWAWKPRGLSCPTNLGMTGAVATHLYSSKTFG